MAEVRVWKVARTADQIRSNMFTQLKGNESGLVSLWNFENVTNGVVKDAGPGGFDGRLAGEAKIIEEQLPGSITPRTILTDSASRQTNAEPIRNLLVERALEFNGSRNSYFRLPANLITNLDEFTFEGWLRWNSFNDYSLFVTLGQG